MGDALGVESGGGLGSEMGVLEACGTADEEPALVSVSCGVGLQEKSESRSTSRTSFENRRSEFIDELL
jgi:hypothetical protein